MLGSITLWDGICQKITGEDSKTHKSDITALIWIT